MYDEFRETHFNWLTLSEKSIFVCLFMNNETVEGKGTASRGPSVGSCLTLRNELSEETHVLTKQEILLERAPRWRGVGEGSPGELLCGLWWWISFQVVFSQSFWLRVLPGGTCLVQPTWMPARILGGGQTCGVSFWSYPNSSGWRWLISSVFLTRTFCPKITHANG